MEGFYLELFLTLIVILLIVLLFSEKSKTKATKIENIEFQNLQKKYLVVFGLATFSDWLQGAYLYKIYSSYEYEDSQIAIIYIFGFLSSGFFGWIIGNIADHFGRKKICVFYNISYMISCYLHGYKKYEILICARILSGLSSCILFSSFESWYIYQHCSKNDFPKNYMNDTFSKSTFINGITAVVAGLTGNLAIDHLKFKYISVFYLAIVILLINSYLTIVWWSETNCRNELANEKVKNPIFNFDAVKFILLGRNSYKLMLIGVIQLLFETAMYDFVFLWTPVLTLNDTNTPFGLVFSFFMMAIMIGSTVYSILSLKNFKPETLLCFSSCIACLSFTLAIFFPNKTLCFFILYEFSIGLYFPCMSYIRSVLIPENIRNSVTNWFRLPINILTVIHLLLIRSEKLKFETVFGMLCAVTACAVCFSLKLRKCGLSRAILPAPICP